MSGATCDCANCTAWRLSAFDGPAAPCLKRKPNKLQPRPGYRDGDLQFRFKRASLTLAVDFDHSGPGRRSSWLGVYLWDHRKNATLSQLAYSSAPITDCYLRAPGGDLEPALRIQSVSFTLRQAEYESLLEHLLPKGIVHHVPEARAVKVEEPVGTPLTWHTPLCDSGCDWCDARREQLAELAGQ